jgi:hypothetical protein
MLAKEYHLPIERLGPEQALADLGIDSQSIPIEV